jgi:Mn2+/Fe2+ NRAMP family transporter
MPIVFQHLPLGNIFGFMWFFLLFIAGVTSSVALTLPAVTFFMDELGWTRKKAVNVISIFTFAASNLVIFFLVHGFMDELDFWAGTFGVVLLALIEIVVFFWVFGKEKAWEEITRGAVHFQIHHEVRHAALPRHDPRLLGEDRYDKGSENGGGISRESSLRMGSAGSHARDTRGLRDPRRDRFAEGRLFEGKEHRMTTGGYIFLVIGWGIVLGLVTFAMTRLFRRKKG